MVYQITDYAEQLLNDLDTLESWPEQVKTMHVTGLAALKGSISFSTSWIAKRNCLFIPPGQTPLWA
nr:hypothetical protein [Yersinia pseudotuberculosis]